MYNWTLRALVVGVVSLVLMSAVGGVALGGASGDPNPNDEFTRPSPDHGVNPTVFPRLWSGDVDDSEFESGSLEEAVLSATDFAFDEPPVAVETWNRGDHRDFQNTDWRTSIYPTHADLKEDRWIEDAYIQVFAIQPSTLTHVSPSDRRLYINLSGSVLATADYRIEIPPDERRKYHSSGVLKRSNSVV